MEKTPSTIEAQIPDAVFNSIKSKFSKAFLYSIGAKANFGMMESNADFDGFGIDFSVHNKEVGFGRTVTSEGSVIHIQLKGVSVSSKSMFKEDKDYIYYNLTKRLDPTGIFYLVVVQLPEEENLETWIEIDSDKLILKKCAYYLRIKAPLKAGFVKIPRSNLLTPQTLGTLFVSSTNKEQDL